MIKLADHGFAIGDIVTFASNDDSTGGIIFQIVANFDSPIPNSERGGRGYHTDPMTGKRLKQMEVEGYMRLKPFFSFFPTPLGKNPKGAGGTVIVYHKALDYVKKVDIVVLATKYAELGNVIKDIAHLGGMEV